MSNYVTFDRDELKEILEAGLKRVSPKVYSRSTRFSLEFTDTGNIEKDFQLVCTILCPVEEKYAAKNESNRQDSKPVARAAQVPEIG